MNRDRSFLSAAGRDWLLPFYDPLVKFLGADSDRSNLLAGADIADARQILDIGCGTDSLAVQIKQLFPETEVTGLDPDPVALRRAERKAGRACAGEDTARSSPRAQIRWFYFICRMWSHPDRQTNGKYVRADIRGRAITPCGWPFCWTC